MACDYTAIRRENEKLYGSDIGRIGPMLLANRYDDRTHFIFELLQNAEDALSRRSGWQGSRSVSFRLTRSNLRVEHFGLPFQESDVVGVCGIANSTKQDFTAIGRFGIGFKSVYAFTDRPEIHSGPEDFAIENFVWPTRTNAIERDPEATVILIPLREEVESDYDDIVRGLGRLDETVLLFLREIDTVHWSVADEAARSYTRESTEIKLGVRRVTIVSQEQGKPNLSKRWLIFSRNAMTTNGAHAGHVELAFALSRRQESQQDTISQLSRSPLVVFFPTVRETHLGFLVQGPYRTTPSRDNVPPDDPWNRHLVIETSSLLVEALHWLRENDLLDVSVLECMPLNAERFGEASMLKPLHTAVKSALLSEPLIPRFDSGHVSAKGARLGRTQELRDLFNPTQLAALDGKEESSLVWLSGEITQDRTPELRHYLVHVLGIQEVTPEIVVSRLERRFLEVQSDEWIRKLYEFLNGQPGLQRRLETQPLLRLEDGTHVRPFLNGQPQAFLPGPIASKFPAVHAKVCSSEESLKFLRSLGLTQPDPVDDVVRNILPKYQEDVVDVSNRDYEEDIERILRAYGTDSKGQREKLMVALRDTPFVMSVEMGAGTEYVSQPRDLYISTERLKELFASVPNVLLTNDRYSCLRREDVCELLEACGAVRYLRPVEPASTLSLEELAQLRAQAGQPKSSGQNDRISDWTLLGLDDLLGMLPKLKSNELQTRARLLWEELENLEEHRYKSKFTAEYSWSYYGNWRRSFDAAFVRTLVNSAWIPDGNGEPQHPGLVLFETLGWKPNPFLQSKIPFKPPIIDQLAKAAGLEPGLLDLLRKLGVTSEADLLARLPPHEEGASPRGEELDSSSENSLPNLPGDLGGSAPALQDPTRHGFEPAGTGQASVSLGTGTGTGSSGDGNSDAGGSGGGDGTNHGKGASREDDNRKPEAAVRRPFISYVAVHPGDAAPDADGLDHAARMAIEEKAIAFIQKQETGWQRAPPTNRGFDLFEVDQEGRAVRWCEVKAMTGSLLSRPIGLSRAQFDFATDHLGAYWLYIVENASDDSPRIVRIRNPAGRARTFTFDRGWLEVAEADSGSASDTPES